MCDEDYVSRGHWEGYLLQGQGERVRAGLLERIRAEKDGTRGSRPREEKVSGTTSFLSFSPLFHLPPPPPHTFPIWGEAGDVTA